jgi:hypothetical protein
VFQPRRAVHGMISREVEPCGADGSTMRSRTLRSTTHSHNLSVVLSRPIRSYGFPRCGNRRLDPKLTLWTAASLLDVEGPGYASERGYGFYPHLSHDTAAVHLHGDFADR